ncbi:MAG: UDP-N-acetylglucosamine--LPS N-acetylglucosamine transferase [Candidatus Eremiobacteraeota bacterium]|nr:UDP-N-acetylglucosamine--LPS N-acetylglucosamine transferase [Candidatus Eremiobacteraeota bacterium]
MRKKIAIFSASVGAGHTRAAEALSIVGQERGLEVVHHDTLDFMPRAFRALYRDAYLDMVGRAPRVFGWLYDLTDRPFNPDVLRTALEEASARRFYKFLDDYAPDLVLCTHFLPQSLVYQRRERKRSAQCLATVITDFDVHGMWLGAPSDHYFVAVPEARAYLRSFGISGRAISVTGIPTHPIFSVPKGRHDTAARLGLRPDLPTLLLSAGGFGTSNLEGIVEALERVGRPIQVIAACGRNQEQKQALEARLAGRESEYPLFHVIGFTTAFDEYMTCSDIVLGKPGGLTTWESFVKGLAWVVVNPIPGQEERNTYHLLEEGVGVWAYEERTLAHKVEELLDPASDRLSRMQERARAMARPRAAAEIIETCLEL